MHGCQYLRQDSPWVQLGGETIYMKGLKVKITVISSVQQVGACKVCCISRAIRTYMLTATQDISTGPLCWFLFFHTHFTIMIFVSLLMFWGCLFFKNIL